MVATVKDAVQTVEKYINARGEVKEIKVPIFVNAEVERAETIIKALQGLTIESAQELLKRVDLYLLQDIIH